MDISEDVERMSWCVPGSHSSVSSILLVHVPGFIPEISRINTLRLTQILTATGVPSKRWSSRSSRLTYILKRSEYSEEICIYWRDRNILKRSEYIEEICIYWRDRNILKRSEYIEEIGIYWRDLNIWKRSEYMKDKYLFIYLSKYIEEIWIYWRDRNIFF